jgi:hypothetical protein
MAVELGNLRLDRLHHVAGHDQELQGNLYKIWNRLSSGTYFPPPVRAVEIVKPHGAGTRVLGVPSVADRVAQTARCSSRTTSASARPRSPS